MSNITNYLNKVKTAIYGKDVRGAIHDAIKQVYDDASVDHDNANMEVKLARGTHNTLNDRLDNVDEIQAQTNAQLSDKALKKDVHNLNARIDNLLLESGDANTEVNDSKYSLQKNISYPTLNNRFLEIEQDSYIGFINLVQNGNLENGTANWSNYGCSISALNNKLLLTGNGTFYSTQCYQITSKECVNNHKIFVSAQVTVRNNLNPRINVSVTGSAGGSQLIAYSVVAEENQKNEVRGIITLTEAQRGFVKVYVNVNYDDAVNANNSVTEVENIVVVDLSDTFGVGNECNVDVIQMIYDGSYFQRYNLVKNYDLLLSLRRVYDNLETKLNSINTDMIVGNAITTDKVSDNAITTDKLSNLTSNVNFIIGNYKYPDINTETKTLTFFNDTILMYKKKYFVLKSDVTIDLNSQSSSTKVIYFDTASENFINLSYAHVPKESYILIATLRYYSNGINPIMSINTEYTVNGKSSSKFVNEIENNVIKNNLEINLLNENIKVINHRGYNSIAPENTIPAFKLSKDKGFKYIECDINFTLDDIPVVIHDHTVDRTSNGTGAVNTFTLNEIKKLDFGAWKNDLYTGVKIPTLEELLIFCKKANLKIYIEIKSELSSNQADTLINLIVRSGMVKNVSLMCFSITELKKIKDRNDKIRLGYLTNDIDENVIESAKSILTTNNDVFINCTYQQINKNKSDMVLDAGFGLESWTIWSYDTVNEFVNYGVSGMTTDSLRIDEYLFNSL